MDVASASCSSRSHPTAAFVVERKLIKEDGELRLCTEGSLLFHRSVWMGMQARRRGGEKTDEMRARTQACTHARTLTLEAAFPFKKSHPTQIRRAHAGSAAAEGEHC